ncbi:hypothetical protein Tco_1009029, partial [Tanacetum coccineum]
NGLDTKAERSRKQLKERKNRAKKIRVVNKVTLEAKCQRPQWPSWILDFRLWVGGMLSTAAAVSQPMLQVRCLVLRVGHTTVIDIASSP